MKPSYEDVAQEENNWSVTDIFTLYGRGLNNAEIARELHINNSTVMRYLTTRRKRVQPKRYVSA